MIRSGDRRTARFQPRRLDNLRPEAHRLIGETFTWTACWLIEEEDSDCYAGQWAWLPDRRDGTRSLGWAPDEDLEGDDA